MWELAVCEEVSEELAKGKEEQYLARFTEARTGAIKAG